VVAPKPSYYSITQAQKQTLPPSDSDSVLYVSVSASV